MPLLFALLVLVCSIGSFKYLLRLLTLDEYEGSRRWGRSGLGSLSIQSQDMRNRMAMLLLRSSHTHPYGVILSWNGVAARLAFSASKDQMPFVFS